jgi:hypothetical protein
MNWTQNLPVPMCLALITGEDIASVRYRLSFGKVDRLDCMTDSGTPNKR